MTPEALAVAVSLYAIAVSVAYFLRDRAALGAVETLSLIHI